MTGFGRAESTINKKQVLVEIKSLNGKQFELSAKLPPSLRAYELDIRSMLHSILVRGSVEASVMIRQDGSLKPMVINADLAIFYFEGMKQIAERLGLAEEPTIATLMRMPEVVTLEQDILADEEWADVRQTIEAAAADLAVHRRLEGESITTDLLRRINNIEELLRQVEPLEAKRSAKIRSRVNQSLMEGVSAEAIDQNRFEQELIYYIERNDISEEKSRLSQHCAYFKAILEEPEMAKGRRLGFIVQEIGREINTLGAKANDAAIQQIVVGMKDELEKAKEQIFNVI